MDIPVVLSTNQILDFLISDESALVSQLSSGLKYITLSKINLPAPSFPFGAGLFEAFGSFPKLTSPSWAVGLALAKIAALIRAADGFMEGAEFFVPSPYQPSLKYCLNNSAEPATTGVAIDVPIHHQAVVTPQAVPPHAEYVVSPFAIISMLNLPLG